MGYVWKSSLRKRDDMFIRPVDVERALDSVFEMIQTGLPYIQLFQAIEVSVTDQASDVFVEPMVNAHATQPGPSQPKEEAPSHLRVRARGRTTWQPAILIYVPFAVASSFKLKGDRGCGLRISFEATSVVPPPASQTTNASPTLKFWPPERSAACNAAASGSCTNSTGLIPASRAA